MSVRRSIIVLTLITLALPFAVFSNRARQLESENPTPTLQLYTVQHGTVEVTITALGNVKADEIANLSLTVPRRVSEVLVQPGDYVLAGDPLVRQVADAEQIAYESAALALQSAQLSMQDLLEGPDERDIRIAQANVSAAQGAYSDVQDRVTPEQLLAAQLEYERAQDALTAAHEARQIAGDLNQEAVALLDAKIGEASFNAEIARLRLEQLQDSNEEDLWAAGARIAQMQAELERVKAGPRQEVLDRASVAIQQAQVDLEQAQAVLDKLTLYAPFEGVVSFVDVEVGELITPGRRAVQLTDIDPLHVNVEVDEVDIRHVREGMTAWVKLDALRGVELKATIRKIDLVGVEDAGIVSYKVDMIVEDADPRVRVGMTAEANVVVDSAEDVLVVPNQYIRIDRRTNRAFVNVYQPDGTVKEIEIELGLQGLDSSQVVSGLNEGDIVAVDLAGNRFNFFGGGE